jgi:hypothetical protein
VTAQSSHTAEPHVRYEVNFGASQLTVRPRARPDRQYVGADDPASIRHGCDLDDHFRAAPDGCARIMRLAFPYRLFGATAAALERSLSIKLIR